MSTSERENLLHIFNEQLRHFSTDTILFHQAVAERLGLNSTDHKCLDIILRNQPITAGMLSDLTGLTTGTVTGVIDRLEKAGYVFREKDPEDRRKVIIRVYTKKAEDEIMSHLESFGQSMKAMLDQYDNEQIRFLFNFFERSRGIIQTETLKLKK
ncbi:MarR family winged helix-turn-helix transcriptional regulator [Paenibacillus mucilaginosus]|uniref:Transcriptional regulator n=2 Tax=Paenibacillus mucilaginosus TaxID=61624 RepID=H6NAQ8_9BACL|nr:MarR family transcriptional regulator [Paenibacillus mucilaginosus]AFC30534.1 transcriptional regulator [Paenibacillus mucilaginosus 3016]MCG7216453.1 MarR family transcriptional regulator [Paenibacillus mucilaginosus]WDM30993.1 MarR family transcriptional regulator [Paenibacillus mucilaginosus]WFA19159.1 MarR family transcriptional regulator [Paenibacillus mucilaginosus]